MAGLLEKGNITLYILAAFIKGKYLNNVYPHSSAARVPGDGQLACSDRLETD
jgi:hypothetical protein